MPEMSNLCSKSWTYITSCGQWQKRNRFNQLWPMKKGRKNITSCILSSPDTSFSSSIWYKQLPSFVWEKTKLAFLQRSEIWYPMAVWVNFNILCPKIHFVSWCPYAVTFNADPRIGCRIYPINPMYRAHASFWERMQEDLKPIWNQFPISGKDFEITILRERQEKEGQAKDLKPIWNQRTRVKKTVRSSLLAGTNDSEFILAGN